jgi:hypothetical protein
MKNKPNIYLNGVKIKVYRHHPSKIIPTRAYLLYLDNQFIRGLGSCTCKYILAVSMQHMRYGKVSNMILMQDLGFSNNTLTAGSVLPYAVPRNRMYNIDYRNEEIQKGIQFCKFMSL